MTQTAVDALVGIVTVALSLTGSAFIAGARWGRIETDLKDMAGRLAKIEGMFTLRLKDPSKD